MVSKLYLGSLIIAALLLMAPFAKADSGNIASPYVLQQALATKDHMNIYSGKNGNGLNLSSGFYSSTSSTAAGNYVGNSLDENFHTDPAGLGSDQRVYALLIDGSYDFNYDLGTGLPMHPYMTGGLGMASYNNTPSTSSVGLQDGGMVPLFRLGGGVTYRLGEQWDLSLDYKAGITGSGGSDQVFTGRSQQPVDLQVLNMGMHYSF